jgi:hypothetical protein
MKPVDDFQHVSAGLWFWQGYEPSVKTDLCSCAVLSGPGLYFIDPIPLGAEPLAELSAAAQPAGMILTNGNHERAAAEYRKRFNVPVFAHEEARGEFDIEADHWIADGATIGGDLTAVQLPGAPRGEIAIHSAAGGGVMLMGDALVNIEPRGFGFLPDKYCADAKLMKVSLRKLLQFSFDAMTFAHGLPVVSGAKKRLEQLLQSS